MQFSRLVEFFEKIEATSLRNVKTEILAAVIKEAEELEVDKLIYLALGSLRPAFDRLEFMMADKMILRALGKSEAEYQEVGDLGELAANTQLQKFRSSPKIAQRSELGVSDVYSKLEAIAEDSGTGSQDRKVQKLTQLLSQMESECAKYIVRIVSGSLRLGFSDSTVIDALSFFVSGNKDHSSAIEQAYQRRPDVGVLARAIKAKGIAALDEIRIELGTPVVPALAQRLKTAAEMIEKMGKVYVEAKYDGTRVQIHFSKNNHKGSELGARKFGTMGDKSEIGMQGSMFEEEKPEFIVKTFTRNLDESSAQFPELKNIGIQIKAESVILDCEAVGYDPKTGKLLPFQMTIKRKRKHDIASVAEGVPLKFFVFDIMYLDGKSLIDLPLRERRKILSKVIESSDHSPIITQGSELKDILVVDEYIETDNPDELRAYHKKQLEAGLEGALVKQKDGKYMPGRSGFNWVKFKEAEDSRAKLADTIDCVIMGYYKGLGKRSGFELGAFLVGVKQSDKIVTVAKVGTGISDEQFRDLGQRLKACEVKEKPLEYEVPKLLVPDVWVEPKVVVEVAADEITISPTHTAGYALRFPRMVKFRDDKSKEQITTIEEVKTLSSI